MTELIVETEPAAPEPARFGGATDVLVYFLSFAFATRYGSQHDLSKLALLLRSQRKIKLEPLLTFADRNVEDAADARELERVWQEAAPLAETLDAVVEALEAGDERIDELTRETPDLLPRLRDLAAIAHEASERGARIRLTFTL